MWQVRESESWKPTMFVRWDGGFARFDPARIVSISRDVLTFEREGSNIKEREDYCVVRWIGLRGGVEDTYVNLPPANVIAAWEKAMRDVE